MLVFSRTVGERVVIEGGIVVQVLEVRGQRIRLGIEAPSEVSVWLGELSAPEEPASTGKRTVRKPR
jgi:carbon storage regulator